MLLKSFMLVSTKHYYFIKFIKLYIFYLFIFLFICFNVNKLYKEYNKIKALLNISDNEIERKKNENKYLPPLPGMSSNLKKKGMIKE